MGDSAHVHGMECYRIQLDCGRSEHSHSKGCEDKNGNLTCGRLEHSHSSSCNSRILTCSR